MLYSLLLGNPFIISSDTITKGNLGWVEKLKGKLYRKNNLLVKYVVYTKNTQHN